MIPFNAGGLKPARMAEVGRSLSRVLVPLAPKDESAVSPAIKPPPINVTPSFFFAVAPRLDTREPVAADDLETIVCRSPQQFPDSRLRPPGLHVQG